MRQVNEHVRMVRAKADCLINSKSEFHQAPLVRVVAQQGQRGAGGQARRYTWRHGDKRVGMKGQTGRGGASRKRDGSGGVCPRVVGK